MLYVLAAIYVLFVALLFYVAKMELLFLHLAVTDAAENRRLRYIAPLRRPSVRMLQVGSNAIAVAIGFYAGWRWTILAWACKLTLLLLAQLLPPSIRNVNVQYGLWHYLATMHAAATDRLTALSAVALAGTTEDEKRVLMDESERQFNVLLGLNIAPADKATFCLACTANAVKDPRVGAELSREYEKWSDIEPILAKLKRMREPHP